MKYPLKVDKKLLGGTSLKTLDLFVSPYKYKFSV